MLRQKNETLRYVALLSVACGLMIPLMGFAQQPDSGHECHYCSEGMYEDMARNAGPGNRLVLDFGSGQVRLFQVSCSGQVPTAANQGGNTRSKPAARSATGSCLEGLQVLRIPEDPELTWAVPVIGEYWRGNGGRILKAVYEFPASEVPEAIERSSVYDFMRESPGRNESLVRQWLVDKDGIGQIITQGFPTVVSQALTRLINTHLVDLSNLDFRLRLVFNDGSRREFLCTSNDNCTVVPGSSYDSENRYVPERTDMSNSYSDTRDDEFNANNLARLILSYGVPIHTCADPTCGHIGSTAVGAPLKLDCGFRSNGDFVCFLVPQ